MVFLYVLFHHKFEASLEIWLFSVFRGIYFCAFVLAGNFAGISFRRKSPKIREICVNYFQRKLLLLRQVCLHYFDIAQETISFNV